MLNEMVIIHGSWIVKSEQNYFFIWGEAWRSLVNGDVNSIEEEGLIHPFCLSTEKLLAFFNSHEIVAKDVLNEENLNSNWMTRVITIPSITKGRGKSKKIQPIFAGDSQKFTANNKSLKLYDWQVEGVCLEATEALNLLQVLSFISLQVDTDYLAGDIRFWCHIYRWCLDLIVRQKFLPGIENNRGIWHPLIDSESDRVRFAKFSQLLPNACLAYNSEESIQSQELLLRSLSLILDTRLRSWLDYSPVSAKDITVQPWLRSLSQIDSPLELDAKSINRLENALYNWTLPISEYVVNSQNKNLGENQYRVCLSLQPPELKSDNLEQPDWNLKYCLQALDEPEFIIDAATIWQCATESLKIKSRTIVNPQETLLKGLGLASRIYQAIADSLEQSQPLGCQLNPIQVYEFIRATAWQLQNNGLGVKLPPGLASGETEQRLGIKITAGVDKRKGDRLNLQSLLKYKLEIAVGDKTVSKKDFQRLLNQKSPIVEINGQWLALQPADVKAAQAVLNNTNEAMNLSVEDALRLSTGDTKVLAKLPVVNFQATGVLAGLINNLTDNKSVEPITEIAGFKGELRPYQAKGVGWLSFLETWGLGACLADDMGLGKCILPESLVYVNGTLRSAEAIWNEESNQLEFDGEGYWSQPQNRLLVNSIDEVTGKIVLAAIARLYRQQISETIHRIKLKDGSVINLTKQHKLLTDKGWTNNLEINDYVCVPNKLIWQGSSVDRDLVKFLAWQIAEGYELNDRATLRISQKDSSLLEYLRQTIINFSQRNGLKINQPQIVIGENGRANDLVVNSQEYQHFITAKGYQWGKRSRYKTIPDFIMKADLDTIRIFLRNYFDAEASVNNNVGNIEISSASQLLIQQLATLLKRFGIWLRIAVKRKSATNGKNILRDYYNGTIGGNGARLFCDEIAFGNSLKQQKLEQIYLKETNNNLEDERITNSLDIDYNESSQRINSLSYNLNPFKRISDVSQEIDFLVNGSNAITLTDDLTTTKQQLQQLLDREVFYCQIESIEEINYTGWVYDFEVVEHHNFVANNIICHNTIQTIGFLLHLKEEDNLTKPTLLVCPTSVLNNWEREVRKFAPNLKTLIHHGDKRNKGKTFAKEVKDKQLVITSYSLVHRDLKTLSTVDWQGIVLDEAQNIKNPAAKQSQSVREIAAGFRIALTGTPVENRLSELWSILDFLNPGFLGKQAFFQKRFAIPIEKYGDRDSLNILRSLVQPFILRRLKTDKKIIQDLPEKQEMNVFCGLSTEQAELYEKLVNDSLTQIEDSEGIKRKGLILTLLLRLKQLCNHPELLNPSNNKKIKIDSGFSKRSGKLLRLEEMLEELIAEGDRALIFTQFSEWGKMIQPYLSTKLNNEVLFLYGATSRQARQEMVDRFQNDPNGPKIFILSLKAGGTGLNLTRANHVFHVDRWWNPAVENQATDRAFRIGQKQNVQVHKFVCSGTLEEKINDIIESKKELAEQTVNAGENWLTKLDTDKLRNLLLLDRDRLIDDGE
ncbi:MAG: SNF2-related protein [Pleurocapsa sp.]